MADIVADVIRLFINEVSFLGGSKRGQMAYTPDTQRWVLHNDVDDTIRFGVSDDSLQALLATPQTFTGVKQFNAVPVFNVGMFVNSGETIELGGTGNELINTGDRAELRGASGLTLQSNEKIDITIQSAIKEFVTSNEHNFVYNHPLTFGTSNGNEIMVNGSNNMDITVSNIMTIRGVAQIKLQGGSGSLVIDSSTAEYSAVTLIPKVSSTDRVGFRLLHGAEPNTLTDGDVWTTTADVFVRLNGATYTLDKTVVP